MSKIDEKTKELLSKGECGLMTHIVIGYPDLKTSEKLVIEMAKAGADFIELQIPFSDPLADGPVIMKACEHALKKTKVSVDDCFEFCNKLSQKVDVPLLFVTYFNIVFNRGVGSFCREASDVGCSGLIVPDLPLEEGREYLNACKKYKIDPILLYTPTTTEERMKKIAKEAKGFIYCVGRTGVTGKKTKFNQSFKEYLVRAHKDTNLPLAVGFGVQQKEDIIKIEKHAEIAVVGTAIINTFEEQGIEGVRNFVKTLKKR